MNRTIHEVEKKKGKRKKESDDKEFDSVLLKSLLSIARRYYVLRCYII
jgi:hypothetical protein